MAELNQIRRLNKKLRQIERLEGARRKLTLEERTKVPFKISVPVWPGRSTGRSTEPV